MDIALTQLHWNKIRMVKAVMSTSFDALHKTDKADKYLESSCAIHTVSSTFSNIIWLLFSF